MASDKTISTPSDALGEGIQKVRAIHGRTSGPTRRSSKGQWTSEEDDILQKAVERFKGKNWKKIAECFKDRTDVQCLHRWQKVLNPELVKGPWSKEEDETIVELVKKFGPKKWSTIAQHLQGRIGKQCRERWHNHLNPSINKEAWTQEEELALIRAHQIYGNKWAELTKYLPGRTDNSIKNHWNSSVKKKLDSYLKSGLLTPIQEQQNKPVNSSSRIQNSGEVEEISECSQDSVAAVRFQSSSEMSVFALQGEEPLNMGLSLPMELDSCPATCSESAYPDLDLSHGIGFVDALLQHNSVNQVETSMNDDYHFDLHDIPNISSLELGHESLEVRSHCNESVRDHEAHLQPSAELATSSLHAGSDKSGNVRISDDECCRILFSEAMKDDCFSGRKLDRGGDSGPSVPQSTEVDGALPSSSQSYFMKLISSDDDPLVLDGGPGHLYGAQEQEYPTCSRDGFIYTNDSANSPCDNTTDVSDPGKLVPVNSFDTRLDTQNCPTDASPNIDTEGSLCYEPPRFPSSDVPFFSCDLIQSGVEMQQEYSPLGIRQLMMSSTNCITPFRLWNSPSAGSSSPEAVLKSAAKTFTGTPSILKKRNREMKSLLSDRRNQKKIETNITSRLAKDFTRLDVFVDADCGAHKAPSTTTDSIENQNPAKTHIDSASEEIAEQETLKPIDVKVMNEFDLTSKKPSGVLIEQNINSLPIFSPKKLDFRALSSSSRTPRSQLHKSSCRKHSLHSSSPTSRKTPEVLPLVESSGQKHSSTLAVTENIACKTGDESISENFSIFGNTAYTRSIESPSAWKSPWFINSFLAGPRVDTDITIEDIGYFMSPGDRSLDAIGLMKQVSEHTAPAYANAQEVLGNETPRSVIEKTRKRGSQEQGTTSLSKPRANRSSLRQDMTEECRVLDFSGCCTPVKDGAENAKSPAAKEVKDGAENAKSPAAKEVKDGVENAKSPAAKEVKDGAENAKSLAVKEVLSPSSHLLKNCR